MDWIIEINGKKYKLVPLENTINIFDTMFKYILMVEGGYSNNANDKGGATNYGITKDLALKCGYNVANITKEQAKEIYYKKYYLKNKLDKVHSNKIALSILDWNINSGVWAIKKAQLTLNNLGYMIRIDGIIGQKTIDGLNSVDVNAFLNEYHRIQELFYKAIVKNNPPQKVFLNGWLNRIKTKIKFIKEM